MTVKVGEGFGVVGDHGVEIESLWIREVRVRNRNRDARPVGGKPAAEAVGVVACAEVVVAGFGVALLAFEFVGVLRACVCIGAFSTIGIKIGVVTDSACGVSQNARSTQRVFDVVEDAVFSSSESRSRGRSCE